MLVTWLAFSGESETEETRSRVHASLCNDALRAMCEIEPNWATSPQVIKPIYALRSQQDIDRDLRTLERRLRDRMVAGRMAIAFLKEALTGQVPKLPAGVTRLSINQMARLVLDDTEDSEPENIETRIWRPSLPVIHLATTSRTTAALSAGHRPATLRLGPIRPSIAFEVAHIAETQPQHRSFKPDLPIHHPQSQHPCTLTASATRRTAIKSP